LFVSVGKVKSNFPKKQAFFKKSLQKSFFTLRVRLFCPKNNWQNPCKIGFFDLYLQPKTNNKTGYEKSNPLFVY
jgi:hypothetical protein